MYSLIAVGVALLSIALIVWKKNHQLKDHEILAKFFVDKNWSSSGEDEVNQSVIRFKINISDDDMKYLQHRLEITRLVCRHVGFGLPELSSNETFVTELSSLGTLVKCNFCHTTF